MGKSLRDSLFESLGIRDNFHEFPEKFKFSQMWFQAGCDL